MRMFWTAMALALVTGGIVHAAAPVSDGSIYEETFTAYPEDPKSQAINTGTVVSGGVVRIATALETEGVFRASPLALPAEYVLEYDWTLNEPSTDNFFMLYNEGSSSPWFSSIALRTILDGATTWRFQIDHGAGASFSPVLNYDQMYHVTVHQKPGLTKPVDLYLDGSLIGTYDSRNPSLTTVLTQFGDPSNVGGYGDATIDNISIGAPVPEPTTAAIAAAGLIGLVASRRRRRMSC